MDNLLSMKTFVFTKQFQGAEKSEGPIESHLAWSCQLMFKSIRLWKKALTIQVTNDSSWTLVQYEI